MLIRNFLLGQAENYKICTKNMKDGYNFFEWSNSFQNINPIKTYVGYSNVISLFTILRRINNFLRQAEDWLYVW